MVKVVGVAQTVTKTLTAVVMMEVTVALAGATTLVEDDALRLRLDEVVETVTLVTALLEGRGLKGREVGGGAGALVGRADASEEEGTTTWATPAPKRPKTVRARENCILERVSEKRVYWVSLGEKGMSERE